MRTHFSKNSRVAVAALAVSCLATATMPAIAAAQPTRAAGQTRVIVNAIYEQVTFGSEGLAEADIGGADSLRLLRARQLATPIQLSTVFGNNWSLDIGTSFASGERVRRVGADGENIASLAGLSDVRARLSRRFVRSGVRFTVGVNIPTGATKLDSAETRALTVLGAPALMMQTPAVGFGPGASIGLAKSFVGASRQWGAALAAGAEWRGQYEPLAALVAGAPANAYAPGPIFRMSGGLTRLIGASKAQLTAAVDIHMPDQIRPVGNAGESELQMGPNIVVDGQWQAGWPGWKSAMLFAGVRRRGDFTRNDTTLAKSGNTVLEGGVRLGRALSGRLDWMAEVSGRAATAIEIDNRLATAASTSVAPSIGLVYNALSWSMAPMVGIRAGTANTGVDEGSFQVLTARLTFERRF